MTTGSLTGPFAHLDPSIFVMGQARRTEHYLQRELYELVRKDVSVFEFLQSATMDGLWYWDLEHPESEWMSPSFWELLGFAPDERQHRASEWQDLINQDDLNVALENFRRHCQDPDHPYDQVVRYRHKNGSTVWVRCRGIAIRSKAGKPIRLLGAHTDLTALKRSEERLRQRTVELEQANRDLQLVLANLTQLSDLRQLEKGLSALTSRQREVLRLLSLGSSMKQAASTLCITPRTIAFHKYRIMEKLGIETSAELVQFAIRVGLIQI